MIGSIATHHPTSGPKRQVRLEEFGERGWLVHWVDKRGVKIHVARWVSAYQLKKHKEQPTYRGEIVTRLVITEAGDLEITCGGKTNSYPIGVLDEFSSPKA